MGSTCKCFKKTKQTQTQKYVQPKSNLQNQNIEAKEKEKTEQNMKINFCQLHNLVINYYCQNQKCQKFGCHMCLQMHNQNHTSFKKLHQFLFSHYNFLELLGEGGSGVVFKVIKLNKNVELALKIIDIQSIFEEGDGEEYSFEEIKNLIKVEIDLHKELNHENIIRYYESTWYEAEKLFLIELELGTDSLSFYLKKLVEEEAEQMFYSICRAVEFLHKNNIIHRDLKPGNILIKELEGDLKIVKLADFGGAKLETLFRSNNKKTLHGGTMGYLAPEKIKDADLPFTTSSDIWALGIIFHQMLAKGVHPFKNLRVNILQNQRFIEPQLKEIHLKIINSCLDYCPEKRANITELIMIVKECINERKYSQKNNNEFEKDLPDSDFEGCMHTKGRDGICHICVGKKKKKKENDKKSLPNFVKKPNPEEEEKEEEEDSDFEGCRHTKGRDGICHICARTKKKKIENNKKSLPKFVKKPYEEKEEEEDSDYEGCRHTKGWDGICHICEGKKKKNNKEILPKILKKPYKDEEEQPPKNQREKIQNDENDDLDLNLIKKLDIDNYIQLEILGKGEFGSVYKIYDKVLKKYIAFKILRIDLFQYTYKDYLCEGVILQNLYQSNPEYFVEYYNTFKNKDENTPSLMLSIQAGIAALSDIMQYRKRYNDSEIIYIILELSTSLALAQEAGFSHGDIKLADVVLFKEKEKLRYKLIDFGLAHRMKKNNIKNTTENEEELYEYRIKGITENYAAPELMKVFSDKFEAKKLINIYKLDIYALGILGLHLMGLKFIFIKEIKQNIDSIEKYKTEYPSSIDFIKKMINLDPKKRINYSELILILKKKEATYPNENFWLERYQENQLKTLTELDLEKYVKLHLEINDIKSARHFCYAWLDKARKNQENKKRMVFCLTKCAELDFSLEYYELGIEHYDEAIALLKNSNEQADVELFQTITKKKQAILIEKEQKKN